MEPLNAQANTSTPYPTIAFRSVTRAQVRGFDCPECGAAKGEQCIGSRGKLRTANHMERVVVALDALTASGENGRDA